MSLWRERETDVEQESVRQRNQKVMEPALKGILLCKKFRTDEQGRHTYEGEFKTIPVGDLPAVCSELYVITKWGDGQGGRFRQEVRIVDPENSLEIFNSTELESDFELDNIYHEHVVVGRISGLFLPRAGRYRVEIFLGDEMKGKTYFNVVL